MLSSRLVGLLHLRRFSRASSISRYGGPFHQCRAYAKTTKKDPKLLEQLSGNEESVRSRSWLNYAIPTVILAIAGAGMYVRYNDEKRAILKGSKESTFSENSSLNRPAIGGPFKLFDMDNRAVTESDLRGNWTLIYFGYTSCPDVGPEEVRKMANVIDILETAHNLEITPVFITIDPQRDTPAQLLAYLKEFHPKIIGLTGPIDAIRQIAQEYRVFFKKVDEEGQDYLVQCSKNMYLLDPNMDVVRFFGAEYAPEQLANEIVKEAQKTSK
ncbi:protein SCO1/2 protein [Dioscorea alata]|uniref:Protein SCO1/2 protein n=1 Tax=Dioscorea alata TaxID=55571 RepID=A0ACB7TXL8_DIOAL|nr:protein SCO1/2 protein [Dioscorea alata]